VRNLLFFNLAISDRGERTARGGRQGEPFPVASKTIPA